MDETNNSSLNVVESAGLQADPSKGLKMGVVASELVTVAPKIVEEVANHITSSSTDNPFQRDTLVFTSVVSTTDTTATTDTITPGVSWFANAYVASRLKYAYAYYGSLVVTYQFNVPPGAFGTYIVSAIPSSKIDASSFTELDGVAGDHVATSRQGLHAMVSMASSTSVQLTLPWLSHKDFQLFSETFTNWRLVLYCLAPLQLNSGGAGTASYSIFIRGGPDFRTMMPNFQAGKLSEVVGAVGGVASAIANFPAAAPIAAPIAYVAGLASRALSALGFTRHTQIETVTHVKHMAACNIVNTDGLDTGNVLALTGANTLTLEGFGGADSFDNMTFEHLFPRPTLIHQFDWATTDGTTTMFTNVGVSPAWCLPPVSNMVRLPVAGYIGLPFAFWRGTMHYELIISASSLMRGSIQVFWCPDSAAPAAALDISNILYNMVCDLESNNSCRFSIGFSGRKPLLKNIILSTSPTTNAFANDYVNGYIGFKVINPLTSMNGAATVKVSLFAWADSDMNFALPRQYIPSIISPAVDLPFATAINYQSGMMGKTLGSTERTVETTVLVPNSSKFSIANSLSGEQILSVRPLLQKFSRMMFSDTNINGGLLLGTGFTNYMDHFGNVRVQSINNGDSPSTVFPYGGVDKSAFNWFRHYSLLFDSMAGSTRYKVYMCAQNSDAGLFPESPFLATGEIFSPSGTGANIGILEPATPLMSDFTVVEPRKSETATEFTIPYYSASYSQACRSVLLNDTIGHVSSNACMGSRVDKIVYRQGDWYNDIVTAGNGKFMVNIFTAGGPDSKFNTFRRVPAVGTRLVDAFPPGIQSWNLN